MEYIKKLLLNLISTVDIKLVFYVIFIFILANISKVFLSNFIIKFIEKIFLKFKVKIEKSSLEKLKFPTNLIYISTVLFIAFNYYASKQIASDNGYALLISNVKHIYKIVFIISAFILTYHILPVILKFYMRFGKGEDSSNELIIDFVDHMTKMIIVAIGIIIGLSEMGINVSALVTGLGLGGLTFALAAKDTATNIFGGIVIISDKQFDVGDWIQTSDVEGVIENITFRSTRIRTFDDSLIIIPNSLLSNTPITNWSKMTKRKIQLTFGLVYSTNLETITKIMEDLKDYLKTHPEIVPDSIIVRFDNFGQSTLDIYVRVFATKTEFVDIKRIKEDINYKTMEIVLKNNTSFAFPSISLYREN